MEQCRLALEQHNWNMEAAVQDRLNEQEGVPSVFNPPPSRPLQVNTADHRIYSYVVSRPQPRGLLGWGYYLIMLPFRFTYYTILDIFRYVPSCLYAPNNQVGPGADTEGRVACLSD